MLYHLFEYLQDTGFPGIRLMTYLSFRAMAAIVLSMLIAFFAGKHIIHCGGQHQSYLQIGVMK